MNNIFSIKSAAMVCIATAVMCFSAEKASAQYGFGSGFGNGFGGSSFNISFSNGFRGSNFAGGGFTKSSFRPNYYSKPVYRPSGFNKGFYGNYYGKSGRGRGVRYGY